MRDHRLLCLLEAPTGHEGGQIRHLDVRVELQLRVGAEEDDSEEEREKDEDGRLRERLCVRA